MKFLIPFISSLLSVAVLAQTPADQGEITGETKKNATEGQLYYEINGLVSMEAEQASYVNGWSKASKPFDTQAMQADSAFTWKGGVLRFDIEFSQPGKYALWVLARKGRKGGKYSSNDFKVWFDRDISLNPNPRQSDRNQQTIRGLMDAEGVQTYAKPIGEGERKRESEMGLGQNYYYVWSSNPKEGKGPGYWVVDQPGRHHLEIITGEEWDYAIDKLILTKDNAQPPQGRGPQATTSSDLKLQSPGLDENVILPPAWAFGVLYGGYTNQAQTLERVREIIAHDYPIDAYWIDSWFWDFQNGGKGPAGYMNFTGDTVAYPNVRKLWKELQDQRIKAGIWIWDGILQKGNERIFEEFKNKNCFKNIVLNKGTWHNAGGNSLIGNFDFENPQSVQYIQSRFKPLFDQGLDFFKLDRNANLPFAKAAFEITQQLGQETKGRGFIIQHIGALDNPAYKRYPTKWSGDSEIKWTDTEYPDLSHYTKGGLTQNIEMVADPRRHEYDVPFLTNDNGGFRSVGNEENLGEELFIRWTQFSCFNPVMEVFSSLYNPTGNLAWKYSPKADQVYKTYTHLRMQLFPYIYTYAHLTRQTGQKMIQGDGVHEHQYLFGKELLVGPVREKGAVSRELYLPEGKWIDYWTGQAYEGNQIITCQAPLETLPLFVKAGAIIPLRDYAGTIEAGSNQVLTLSSYPHGTSSFTLYEDDGISNEYLSGKFTKTSLVCRQEGQQLILETGAAEGSFAGQLKNRTFLWQVHQAQLPQKVMLRNKQLQQAASAQQFQQAASGWFFDSSTQVVQIKIQTPAKNATKVTISY